MEAQSILVLCTGNSCRSQMAEAYLKHFSEELSIHSAGLRADGLNPLMVQVMREDGIDVSGQRSTSLNELGNTRFDMVITVCDHAKESCPYFPADTLVLHRNFRDPAKATGTPEEVIAVFRNVRNEIKAFCRDFMESVLPNYYRST